jgi:PTH1 family peptidyl-tRNA hydrolase
VKFVVGIGNPGARYEGTRHNVGFDAARRLAEKAGAGAWQLSGKYDALVAELEGGAILQPQTFVNNTGGTLRAVLAEYRDRAEFLVVCDDANLDLGKLRLRREGSAGGHHGLESVIAEIGEGFARLRIGVRTPSMPTQDLSPFVLGPFGPGEREAASRLTERAAEVCQTWFKEGFDAAERRLSRLQSENKE